MDGNEYKERYNNLNEQQAFLHLMGGDATEFIVSIRDKYTDLYVPGAAEIRYDAYRLVRAERDLELTTRQTSSNSGSYDEALNNAAHNDWRQIMEVINILALYQHQIAQSHMSDIQKEYAIKHQISLLRMKNLLAQQIGYSS